MRGVYPDTSRIHYDMQSVQAPGLSSLHAKQIVRKGVDKRFFAKVLETGLAMVSESGDVSVRAGNACLDRGGTQCTGLIQLLLVAVIAISMMYCSDGIE